MFAARGIALSLSVFILLYGSLSLLLCGGWRLLWRHGSLRYSSRRSADLLFGLRVLPFVASALVTLAFMVPSFLLLEPHSGDEPLGAVPIALSFCCLALFMVGVVRAAIALRRTGRIVAECLSERAQVAFGGLVHVFEPHGASPALTAAGVRKPQILLSEQARKMLTRAELRSVLRHEIAHIRRRDNLKKLVFLLLPFPGMVQLERAWLDASEMAADATAVCGSSDAVDLASALIKVSCMALVRPLTALTTALVRSKGKSLDARVRRLLIWNPDNELPASGSLSLYGLSATIGTILCVALFYSAILVRMHMISEWLVR
jgi:beta-lactamase regulating signal transducer with metallopeptidase domain